MEQSLRERTVKEARTPEIESVFPCNEDMLTASRSSEQSGVTALRHQEEDLEAGKHWGKNALDLAIKLKQEQDDEVDHKQGDSTDSKSQIQSTNNLDRNLASANPRMEKLEQISLCDKGQESHFCARCCLLFPTLECLREHKATMHADKIWQPGRLSNTLPHNKNKKGSKITDIANKLLNLKSGASVSDFTVKENAVLGLAENISDFTKQENAVLGLAENKLYADTMCQKSATDACETVNSYKILQNENCDVGLDNVSILDRRRDSCEVNINNKIPDNLQDQGYGQIHGEGSSPCKLCGVELCQCSSEITTAGVLNEDKPYKCVACNTGFTREGHLLSHYRVHTGEKPYKCDVCDVSFAQRNNLRRHKRVHTALYPYKCDVCGVAFAEKSNLKRHKRIHTGEKLYKCDVCGTAFTECSNLKRHKRTHTKEKPFKCDICGVGFAVGCSLKTHRRIHTGEKPYTCDICGAGFAQSNNLKKHRWTHAAVKPFKCDICGTGFSDRGSMKTHMRRHTGEKPYKCQECGLAFGDTANLYRHKMIHTGVKPFKCDVCDVAFTDNSKLKRHLQIHAREKS